MAEVKLPAPVPATLSATLGKGRWTKTTRPPAGAVWFVDKPARGKHKAIHTMCPCGCGSAAILRIYTADEPAPPPDQHPAWLWNGDKLKPTLTPSVHHIGHWHGYLRDGVWVDA